MPKYVGPALDQMAVDVEIEITDDLAVIVWVDGKPVRSEEDPLLIKWSLAAWGGGPWLGTLEDGRKVRSVKITDWRGSSVMGYVPRINTP